ncbi:hypothetical protein RB195_010513 [Necator americanus]|uniref:ELYS-like domain-containing protein n=1 Tax=Necator americanus TaxID=51031 RepID=A0ABR1CZP9_NECAM
MPLLLTFRFYPDDFRPEIEERISKVNPSACVNALQVISELHCNLPSLFSLRLKKLIAEFVVPGLILSYETDPEDADSFDPLTPLEEQPIPKYCLSKVFGMKLLARYLFTCGGDTEDDSLARKTLRMFIAFIRAVGDLHDSDKNISAVEKAWLRTVAGTSLLKLCYIQKYSHMMGADMFVTLASLMKDEADCVRGYFVRRLNKGILRNRLTIEYLSFFSLVALINPGGIDEEKAVKIYREQCCGYLLAAISRRRNLIQSSSFSSMYLPYHQPEYAIAYAVWLLSHQEMLSTHSDVANIAILQECLWFTMEPFLAKKEKTDFEFIYCLLQDIKESNDALFEKRRKDGEIGEAELVGQSKKMWALADLGMLMLVYRGKITIRNEPRRTLLSTRFFIREKNSKHAGMVYAPNELIEDEKDRNGKLPSCDRKRLNITCNTTTTKKTTRKAEKIVKIQRGRGKLDKDVNSSPSNEDLSPERKSKGRKPLKIEQKSLNTESEQRVKQSIELPIRSSPGSSANHSSMKSRSSNESDHLDKMNDNMAVEGEASPSTSEEQPYTRNLRSRKSQLSFPNTRPEMSQKRFFNVNASSVEDSNNTEGVTIITPHNDAKTTTWPTKRQRPSLGNLDDMLHFSPITRSGEKSTKRMPFHAAPLSTSTPMPTSSVGKSSKRRKLTIREAKAVMSKLTDEIPKKEKEMNDSNTLTKPTRSKRPSVPESGSYSPVGSASKNRTTLLPLKQSRRPKRIAHAKAK